MRSLISRRAALAGTSLLAAPAILIGAKAKAAETFILGTWGGDYQRLMMENIEMPIARGMGIESIADAADEVPRASKIMASRRLPKGQMDVACLGGAWAYSLAEAGALEEITVEKVPNLVHARKDLLTPTFIPHIWSPQIISYNPERVKTPPTSFADLLDPKYKGKVGFPSGNYQFIMMAAGLYGSGNSSNFDKAKELMLKLNDNGLRLYPSTDAGGPPFKTGELDVGMMWLARIAMWQNAGIPVAAAFPKEGCMLYVSGMVVPKNAPNKEAAFKYLNAMLEPKAQLGFAQNMGYLPTVDNAPLSGKVAEQLALPNPLPKLIIQDYATNAKVLPDVTDWWKKNIEHS